MKNIKVNAIANLLMRVLNIVFPLITGPYIARILNKTEYGYFNITNTFIGLFIPFATLGIYNYGIRAISKAKENKQEINRIFSLLFYISLFCTTITTIVYFIITFQMEGAPVLKTLYYIMAIQVFAQFLNIEWMNEAYENYTFILYKTLFIRVAMLVSIFAFVKTEDDIIPYAIIMTATTIFNYLLSFLWIKREVSFVKIEIKELIASTKTLTTMLLLANANMLYTLLDRMYITKGPDENYISYYTIALSIIMLIANVLGGALNVSIPRLSYYLGNNDYKSYQYLINTSSSIFLFLMLPISFGLMILGTYATVIYSSEKYLEAGIVTSIFALRTIIWAIELILGKQIIFINDFESKLTSLYFIGGGVNIVLNTLLYFNGLFKAEYYIGTTIIAESVVVILEIMFIKKHNLVNLNTIFSTVARYSLVSLGFIPIYYLFKYIFNVHSYAITLNMLIMVCFVVATCGLYYLITLFILKDKTLHYAVNIVKGKLKRN